MYTIDTRSGRYIVWTRKTQAGHWSATLALKYGSTAYGYGYTEAEAIENLRTTLDMGE